MEPNDLASLFNQILTEQSKNSLEKTQRIVGSLTQDICDAVTNSEWKLPKYISMYVFLASTALE